MGTFFLNEVKKQASSFLQEKYKTARLALTDVTQAELLTEEATNNDSWGPDARTMTRIAEASFDIDDYWRIVDILHRRLDSIDWKQWRQSYKALVLLDFLLTHGPEDFAEEFQCDMDVIQELGTFYYIDERGFNWGANMQSKSERILKLLRGGEDLKEARLKAIKVTREIQGFGNLMISPSPPSSASSSSRTSRTSFGSFSSGTSIWNEADELNKNEKNSLIKELKHDYSSNEEKVNLDEINENMGHLWDSPIQETGSLIDTKDEDEDEMDKIFKRKIALRSFSDVGKTVKNTLDRQFSLKY